MANKKNAQIEQTNITNKSNIRKEEKKEMQAAKQTISRKSILIIVGIVLILIIVGIYIYRWQKIKEEEITEQLINSYLYTKDMPEPDLIIRTSGEQRLSGFLAWQSTYSELYFIQKNWPDFTENDLEEAIKEYNRRTRKFGAN